MEAVGTRLGSRESVGTSDGSIDWDGREVGFSEGFVDGLVERVGSVEG